MTGAVSEQRALVVGCGYAGERLVTRLLDAGYAVDATARRARHVANIATVELNLDLEITSTLPRHDSLFYLVPPQPDGDDDLRSRALIDSLSGGCIPARSVTLVSTTGVYGDVGGAEGDESSPLTPGTARARRRVASEQVWRSACSQWGVPLTVLRVAGIYGPGRLPRSRIESGEPLLEAALSPVSNRIHVDDLVKALLETVGLNETVDVADGDPLPLTTFYHCLADSLGMARLPETADVAAVPVVRAGFGESRRVPARRLRELLGPLKYPSVLQGLPASVQGHGE